MRLCVILVDALMASRSGALAVRNSIGNLAGVMCYATGISTIMEKLRMNICENLQAIS